ncbi:hypothetical protein FJZ22_02765 [Candidatus Pacearchaeota archaeon]|nr:hypothetical protein [Candidatus Pacearchaeota archaeon]
MKTGKEGAGSWKNWVIGVLVIVILVMVFYKPDVRLSPPLDDDDDDDDDICDDYYVMIMRMIHRQIPPVLVLHRQIHHRLISPVQALSLVGQRQSITSYVFFKWIRSIRPCSII